MNDIKRARRYLDSIVIASPALAHVDITTVPGLEVKGHWYVPRHTNPELTLLYLHGGGYSLYPRSYSGLIASVTLAANSRTFALNYRLAPEHRFPAALKDALAAYRWLLDYGTDPEKLIVAGDSAGGNLALALLIAARDAGLSQPARAIVLSPATDFVTPVELGGRCSIIANAEFDWIQKEMLVKWADWFCDPQERGDPLVSPIYADLRGLCPIYIQAGRLEILYDSIQAFQERAREQGADVLLEAWDDMNHDFQMFGNVAPQSVAALRRIGEVCAQTLAGSHPSPERT